MSCCIWKTKVKQRLPTRACSLISPYKYQFRLIISQNWDRLNIAAECTNFSIGMKSTLLPFLYPHLGLGNFRFQSSSTSKFHSTRMAQLVPSATYREFKVFFHSQFHLIRALADCRTFLGQICQRHPLFYLPRWSAPLSDISFAFWYS